MSFQSIVVGTDGSDTARKAVEEAADLAKQTSGDLHIVMAAQQVPESRLRSERAGVPDDVAHTVNPNEDAEAELKDAAAPYESEGITVHTHAKSRAIESAEGRSSGSISACVSSSVCSSRSTNALTSGSVATAALTWRS